MSPRSTRPPVRNASPNCGAPRPRRPAIHPWCRRKCGQRVPCRERLSKDRRSGMLRSHGQRLRADRQDQRRGLGQRVCRVAARQPPQRQGRAADPFGRWWNLEKNVSPNLVAAIQLAKQVGARVIGWWARMAATPRRPLMCASSCPRSTPTMSRRIPRPFRRSLAPLRDASGRKGNQTKWESFSPAAAKNHRKCLIRQGLARAEMRRTSGGAVMSGPSIPRISPSDPRRPWTMPKIAPSVCTAA